MKQRDPGLASVFSFFVPGLGQIYNGLLARGLIHFVFHLAMLCGLLLMGLSLVQNPTRSQLAQWLANPLNLISVIALALGAVVNWLFALWDTIVQDDPEDEYLDEVSQETTIFRNPELGKVEVAAVAEKRPLGGFAQVLREVMELKDINLDELSEQTGISKSELSSYLAGDPPSQDVVKRIAFGLDVSVELLLQK